MRKLKFRIWNKTDKHLTQPHAISQELIENDNLVIMQFTGLLDKRGVEIYEGDVVRATTRGATFTTKQGIIEWVDYLKALGVHIFDEDIDDSKPVGFFYELEVIGNIYENPDLLTPKENN